MSWSGDEHPPLKSHRWGSQFELCCSCGGDLGKPLNYSLPLCEGRRLNRITFKVSSSPKVRALFSSSWQEDPVAKANMPRLQVSLVSKSKSKKRGAHSPSTSCPCSSAGWHPLQPPTLRCCNPHHKPVSWKSKPGDHLTSNAMFKGTHEATQAFFKVVCNSSGWLIHFLNLRVMPSEVAVYHEESPIKYPTLWTSWALINLLLALKYW